MQDRGDRRIRDQLSNPKPDWLVPSDLRMGTTRDPHRDPRVVYFLRRRPPAGKTGQGLNTTQPASCAPLDSAQG